MGRFRIYPSKANTIASGTAFERLNSSQNPVTDLWYGGGATDTAIKKRNSISRHLVQFDLSGLIGKLSTAEINSANTITYKLRFKNVIPSDRILEPEYEFDVLNKSVASSFDLIAFPINKEWDEGRGYDLETTKFLIKQKGNLVLSGVSNWLSATTFVSWDEPGVFENPTASTANFSTQHFALGSEDLDMDITSIVNEWIFSGTPNNGLGIAYSRPFELLSTDTRYISSFFTQKTNSAFKPFIEVVYNQPINDDRHQVTNNRLSRLFLYLFSGNASTNYFSAGTVSIKTNAGADVFTGLTPTHHSLGVYYVDVFMSGTTKGQKFKDVWSNITFSPGFDQTTFTQTFDIKDNYYTNNARSENAYAVTTYGLDNNSIIRPGEVMRVYAETRVNYGTQNPFVNYGLEYRMDMSVNNEVIPWTQANSAVIDGCLKSFFDIDTSWLLNSQMYVITLRIAELGTKRVLPETINFRVLSDTGNPRL
jgi:hypothetical protein